MATLTPTRARCRTRGCVANGELTLRSAKTKPNKPRSTLSKNEKLNFIDAVKCIHEKPALTPSSIAAGAKSRYDDFVVTHVKQTYWVHGTVRLISSIVCVAEC